ncbi:MAG TPA: cupin domain-containing protein [Candidatus Binatia bacterium]|nr:cupin domain-containing protein [Candidatus Binatia bacterium]
MKKIGLGDAVARKPFFEVLETTPRGQVALMCLERGQESGPGLNTHPSQDQWLYVVEGEGTLRNGKEEIALRAGDLARIEPGEPHQVVGGSETTLVTLEFYSPPAY